MPTTGRRHRSYPGVVKRARHNSHRIKKPGATSRRGQRSWDAGHGLGGPSYRPGAGGRDDDMGR